MYSSAKNKIKNILNDEHMAEIIHGSFIAFFYKIIGVGLGYFLIFLISKYFNAEGVGLYYLGFSILSIVSMFGKLGITLSALRFIGELKAKKKINQIKELYFKSAKPMLIVSVITGLLLIVFNDLISNKVFNESNLKIPLIIIGVLIPFLNLNDLNIEFIRGLKRLNMSEFFRNFSRPCLNVLFLIIIFTYTKNIFLPFITLSLALIFTFFASYLYLYQILLKTKIQKKKTISTNKILKTSFPMMISGFSALIMLNTDSIMIGFFLDTINVGIYTIALKYATIISFIIIAINTIAAPKMSELFWSKKKKELEKTVKFSTFIMIALSTPILFLISIFPNFFLSLFGNQYVDGKIALLILIFGQFFSVISGSSGILLNMSGYQKGFQKIVISGAILNVLLNIILIPKFGINGAAIATASSTIYWNSIAFFFVKMKLGFLPMGIYRK